MAPVTSDVEMFSLQLVNYLGRILMCELVEVGLSLGLRFEISKASASPSLSLCLLPIGSGCNALSYCS